MQDKVIDSKVSVFISSRCGDGNLKYTIVRKGLKDRLEDTGIVQVYTFEDAAASSNAVEPAYLNRIDYVDLCIFLVDNKDDVSDPILKEQKRAKDLNKKILYIFCKEEQKEPTRMQLEIRGDENCEKYSVISEFSDFINEAFRSVIQDIIYTYKEKTGIHKRDQSVNNLSLDNIPNNIFTINKELFQGFDLTKQEILKLIFPNVKNVKPTNEIDALCKEFLRTILGLSNFNVKKFHNLSNLIIDIHNKELQAFIEMRFNAIKSYFLGDLNSAISKLEIALKEADANPLIPNWLANDVAIDLRNIEHLVDTTNNQITFESKYEQYIEDSTEPLYYPMIDRIDDNLNEKLLNMYFSFNSDSPYSVKFGNYLEEPLNKIAYCFYISVIYGSITHSLITRKRLINTLQTLSYNYKDHNITIELISLLILERRNDDIETMIRQYNLYKDILNSNDIEKILNRIRTLKFENIKFECSCLMVQNFGYYFSDEQYKDAIKKLSKYIEDWFDDDQRIINVVDYYIKMLYKNTCRIDVNEICKFFCKFIKLNFTRWFDDIFGVLSILDFNNANDEIQDKVLKCIISILEDKNETNISNYNNLFLMIVAFRKTSTIKCDILDKIIKERYYDFYSTTYSLEIFNKDKKSFEFIAQNLEKIKIRNVNQGKNGYYEGYFDDHYIVIKNIIEFDNMRLKECEINIVVNTIKETLISSKQEISDKMFAIDLLMYLINKFPNSEYLQSIFDFLIDNKTEILRGHFNILNKCSLKLLDFTYNLLLSRCKSFKELNIINLFINAANFDDYETIKALQFIKTYLYQVDYSKIPDIIVTTIFQYVISKYLKRERDIRLLSVQVLLQLINSKLKKVVLQQLSIIMDNGTSDVKICILDSVKNIPEQNNDLIKYILQKGNVDTNYLVRKVVSLNLTNN